MKQFRYASCWLILMLLWGLCIVQHNYAIGQTPYVSERVIPNGFPIIQGTVAAAIHVDSTEWPGVIRAAKDLQADIFRVTGRSTKVSSDNSSLAGKPIIIGTVGKSDSIRRLVNSGKIDISQIEGKWESFFLQAVRNPFPGTSSALVIVGSDKRATIFGIYDLCEQMGVSPALWWADVPVRHKDELFIKPGKYLQGSPSVKYRGIFLNDEAPDLSGWVSYKFGTVPPGENPPIPPGVANYNHEFYSRIFEIILRMKGNYLWPAMWNNAFNEDDAENARLADEYGIVMGTSHQEPMLRAQKEWDRRFKKTLGSWNYFKTPDILQGFWRNGLRRNKNYESILTIGLRGADDTPMIPGGTVPQSMALLEEIVGVQRKIISEEINPDVAAVPQAWCLYKEVQEYYNAGLRVPDDVTLLWADDNWGNIRRLPTESERARRGGAGVYYHFDYVGGPRNYKWVNTVSLPAVWEQMTRAKEYGADRIWIVNVGHFKHLLFPAEFFLQLGWNTNRWTNQNLGEYTQLWAAREFGPQHAEAIADVIEKYTKYNARRKPELLSPTTYSLTDYREAEKIVVDFNVIRDKAEKIYESLPSEAKDAFYELVLFPVKACAQVNELYVAAGKNSLYVRQGRATANDWADRVQELFDADAKLTAHYNQTFAGGKWNHFMDQVHIGYTIWQDPPGNVMPQVKRIELPSAASMGIAIEGSASFWPGSLEIAKLPLFDAFNRQQYYVDVFNRGRNSFQYTAKPEESWILVSMDQGNIEKENRLWVSIDWKRAPKGLTEGTLQVSRPGGELVEIKVPITNPDSPARDTLAGFIEGAGYIAIEAEHYSKNIPTPQARWEKIEGYGRTLSAMSIFPMKSKSVIPPENSPCLEYKIYVFNPGKAEVIATVAPTLNFVPGQGLRIAVSLDEETPQIVDILPGDFDARNGNREWEDSVRNASRTVRSTHEIGKAGAHTLKIWMVDPSVVLQRIMVDLGGLKPSYLGAPESYSKN